MRVETLESALGLHNGELEVVRYRWEREVDVKQLVEFSDPNLGSLKPFGVMFCQPVDYYDGNAQNLILMHFF